MERRELLAHFRPIEMATDSIRDAPGLPPNSSTSSSTRVGQASLSTTSIAPKRQPFTASEKLGRLRRAGIVLAAVAQLGALGFLIFLWTGPSTNQSWVSIVTKNWAARGVTTSALVLRFGADFFAGIAASMLAAVVLESGTSRISATASLSTMRSSAPSVWQLLAAVGKSGTLLHRWVPLQPYFPLAVLLAGVTIALQFSSTILLSDFQVGDMPGLSNTTTFRYDPDWKWSKDPTLMKLGDGSIIYGNYSVPGMLELASPWTQTPARFPLFGEYSGHINSTPAGVDDTGYLLRAFLPFAESEQRRSISKFRGDSFVLDSRVSCQPPVISNLAVNLSEFGHSLEGPAYWASLSGTVSNSTQVQDLWLPPGSDLNIPFYCYILVADMDELRPRTSRDNLRVALCQIQAQDPSVRLKGSQAESKYISLSTEAAGSLRSQLFKPTVHDDYPSHSPAFLIIAPKVPGVPGSETLQAHAAYTAQVTRSSSLRFSNNPKLVLPPKEQDFLFSVCYTSWTSTNAVVKMTTDAIRAEPNPGYSNKTTFFQDTARYDSALQQLGVGKGNSDDRRAVLSMDKPSYSDLTAYPLQQESIVHRFGDLDSIRRIFSHSLAQVSNETWNRPIRDWPSFSGRWTALLYASGTGYEPSRQDSPRSVPAPVVVPSPAIRSFFMQAMERSNNSAATSLSALLTVISSMTYYDQLPVLTRNGSADVVFFESVAFPRGSGGLIAVIVLLLTHYATVALITFLFLSRTRYTRLGQAWMAVAQVSGGPTEGLLSDGSMAADHEIKKKIKDEQSESDCIRIAATNAEGDTYGCVLNEGSKAKLRRPALSE